MPHQQLNLEKRSKILPTLLTITLNLLGFSNGSNPLFFGFLPFLQANFNQSFISQVTGYYCSPSYSSTYSPAAIAATCTAVNCPVEGCVPTVSSSCTSLAIRREESPDSGYGGIMSKQNI